MYVDKEIYLINNGLSCKEIYEKINREYLLKKKKGLSLNNDNKKILSKLKSEKKNKLSLNGIIESRELKKNRNMNNLKESTGIFYSICDRQSIETALVSLNHENPLFLFVLPYIKFCADIKKPNDVTEFIKSFPSINNRNNISQYWKINNNILNSNNNVDIDWSKTDTNSYSKIRSFDVNKLIKFIIEQRIALSKDDHLTLFCNEFIIKKMLKLITLDKQKPSRMMKIYNTHCIKLVLRTNGTKMSFVSFDTIYPKELKPEPLIFKNNNFNYRFKGQEYVLNYMYFSNKYPDLELKITDNCRCIHQENIQKIVKLLKGKENNNSKKRNIKKNINNVQDFNNIFNKLNLNKN